MGDGLADYKYDVFISYSRKDVEFARKLQRTLSAYAPPREVPVPQRRLRVFRDESDFQGTEYQDALEQNLKSAAKLLVIASPNSRASDYVGGEIRAFAALHGKEHIISLLLDGVPNNELAVPGAQKAFHDELVSRLPIPLAADYRGCGPRDRLDRDRFEGSWYKTLADIYANYNVDRNTIEQREKGRQRRIRRIRTALVSVVTLALASLTIWALISRREAIAQRNTAQSRLLAAQSLSRSQSLEMTLLLAAAAYRTAPTAEAWEALYLGLQRQPSVARFLHGHNGVPAALAISGDGACAAALSNNRIVVWNLQTGKTIASIEQPDRRPTAEAFGSDCGKLVLGFEDGGIEAWNLAPSPVRHWFVSGSGKSVTAVAVNTRDGKLAVGHVGGRLALRHLDSGAVVAETQASIDNSSRVVALKFNSEGSVLASIDWNGTVRRWGAIGLVPVAEPVKCLGGWNGIYALSPDLTRCASSASPHDPATVTNLNNPGKPEAQFGQQWLLAVDFSHDGRRLITATQGGELQLWDLDAAKSGQKPAKPEAVFSEHHADVTAVAYSQNDNVFISGARDQSVIVWRPASKSRLVKEIPTVIPDFGEAAVDSSLREIVTANKKGDLFRSNLGKPEAPVPIGSFGMPISALAIREESQEIFAGASNGDVLILKIESGNQRRLLTGHHQQIENLRLDAAGLRLAAVAENGTVSLWNLASGQLIATFPEKNLRTGRSGLTPSVDVAFGPDADRLASVHGDQQAFLWQKTNTGYRFDPFLYKPTSYFTSIAFSPDGRTVALGTGIYEGGIALFDSLNTKPASVVLTGHDLTDVTGLAFSPDGRFLMSGGFDRRINVWDVAGRRRIGEPYFAPGVVETVAFAKTASAAVAVTNQGTVLLWDFDPANWLEIVCRIANRNLTVEERVRFLGSATGEFACPMLE